MHDQYQNNPSQQANVPTHQFATVTKVESDLPRHFSEDLVYTDNDIATNEAIMSAMVSPVYCDDSWCTITIYLHIWYEKSYSIIMHLFEIPEVHAISPNFLPRSR